MAPLVMDGGGGGEKVTTPAPKTPEVTPEATEQGWLIPGGISPITGEIVPGAITFPGTETLTALTVSSVPTVPGVQELAWQIPGGMSPTTGKITPIKWPETSIKVPLPETIEPIPVEPIPTEQPPPGAGAGAKAVITIPLTQDERNAINQANEQATCQGEIKSIWTFKVGTMGPDGWVNVYVEATSDKIARKRAKAAGYDVRQVTWSPSYKDLTPAEEATAETPTEEVAVEIPEDSIVVHDAGSNEDLIVAKDDWNALPDEYKNILTGQSLNDQGRNGYDAMQWQITSDFEAANVELGDGQWMPKENFSDLQTCDGKYGTDYAGIAKTQGVASLLSAMAEDERVRNTALTTLKDYKEGDGYNVDKFIYDHPTNESVQTIKDAGFDDEVVDACSNYVQGVQKFIGAVDSDNFGIWPFKKGEVDVNAFDKAMLATAREGVSWVWPKLSNEDKQKVASYYVSDPFKGNPFASYVTYLDVFKTKLPAPLQWGLVGAEVAGFIIAPEIAMPLAVVEMAAPMVAKASVGLGNEITITEVGMTAAMAAASAIPYVGPVVVRAFGTAGKVGLGVGQAGLTGLFLGGSVSTIRSAEVPLYDKAAAVLFDVMMARGLVRMVPGKGKATDFERATLRQQHEILDKVLQPSSGYKVIETKAVVGGLKNLKGGIKSDIMAIGRRIYKTGKATAVTFMDFRLVFKGKKAVADATNAYTDMTAKISEYAHTELSLKQVRKAISDVGLVESGNVVVTDAATGRTSTLKAYLKANPKLNAVYEGEGYAALLTKLGENKNISVTTTGKLGLLTKLTNLEAELAQKLYELHNPMIRAAEAYRDIFAKYSGESEIPEWKTREVDEMTKTLAMDIDSVTTQLFGARDALSIAKDIRELESQVRVIEEETAKGMPEGQVAQYRKLIDILNSQTKGLVRELGIRYLATGEEVNLKGKNLSMEVLSLQRRLGKAVEELEAYVGQKPQGERIEASAGAANLYPSYNDYLVDAKALGYKVPMTKEEFVSWQEEMIQKYVEEPAIPQVRRLLSEGNKPYSSNVYGPGKKGIWYTDRAGKKHFEVLAWKSTSIGAGLNYPVFRRGELAAEAGVVKAERDIIESIQKTTEAIYGKESYAQLLGGLNSALGNLISLMKELGVSSRASTDIQGAITRQDARAIEKGTDRLQSEVAKIQENKDIPAKSRADVELRLLEALNLVKSIEYRVLVQKLANLEHWKDTRVTLEQYRDLLKQDQADVALSESLSQVNWETEGGFRIEERPEQLTERETRKQQIIQDRLGKLLDKESLRRDMLYRALKSRLPEVRKEALQDMWNYLEEVYGREWLDEYFKIEPETYGAEGELETLEGLEVHGVEEAAGVELGIESGDGEMLRTMATEPIAPKLPDGFSIKQIDLPGGGPEGWTHHALELLDSSGKRVSLLEYSETGNRVQITALRTEELFRGKGYATTLCFELARLKGKPTSIGGAAILTEAGKRFIRSLRAKETGFDIVETQDPATGMIRFTITMKSKPAAVEISTIIDEVQRILRENKDRPPDSSPPDDVKNVMPPSEGTPGAGGGRLPKTAVAVKERIETRTETLTAEEKALLEEARQKRMLEGLTEEEREMLEKVREKNVSDKLTPKEKELLNKIKEETLKKAKSEEKAAREVRKAVRELAKDKTVSKEKESGFPGITTRTVEGGGFILTDYRTQGIYILNKDGSITHTDPITKVTTTTKLGTDVVVSPSAISAVQTGLQTYLQSLTQGETQAKAREATEAAVRQALQTATQTAAQAAIKTSAKTVTEVVPDIIIRPIVNTITDTVIDIITGVVIPPPPPPPPAKIIPIIPPAARAIKKALKEGIPVLIWRQGALKSGDVWEVVIDPERQRGLMTVIGTANLPVPPRKLASGKGSAKATVQWLGRGPTHAGSADLGIMDVYWDRAGENLRFESDGLSTDVGTRIPGPTTGISIEGMAGVDIENEEELVPEPKQNVKARAIEKKAVRKKARRNGRLTNFEYATTLKGFNMYTGAGV